LRGAQEQKTVFCSGGRGGAPYKGGGGGGGSSVQSTTGSRDVRISCSNVGYTMFRTSVKGTGYSLHSPVSPSLPHPLRHRVPSRFNWTPPGLITKNTVVLVDLLFSYISSTVVIRLM